MNKKGLTMLQIVIYVVIFFALVAIATGTSMAMNSNALKDKGQIYVNEAELKLKQNFLYTINESGDIPAVSGAGNNGITDQKILFSNDDIYEFDSDAQIIKKNGGILVQNVTKFELVVPSSTNGWVYEIKVTITKYGNENEFTFKIFKGEVV